MTTELHWGEPFFGSLYMRFDELRMVNIAREVAGIIHLTGIEARTRVAELCCGYGRLLIPLAAKSGAKATGFDKSRALLTAARFAAQEQGIPAHWIEADLRRYRGRNEFDVAYLAATSFGYYADKETNCDILRAARSCLKTGGVFLLEQANRPRRLNVKREDGQFIYEMRSDFDPASRRYTGTYKYVDKISHRIFDYPFSATLYRHADLVDMLRETGFSTFRSHSGLSRRPFAEKAKRLVIVCRAA
jgi:SAM-dependent methyltransferase